MRVAVIFMVALLASCATEKLALAPPAGVDFSGTWRVNLADSDEPQRLLQSAHPGAGERSADADEGGRRSGRGLPTGLPSAPVPPLPLLSESLEWPGNDIHIKQIGGAVVFSSNGLDVVYQPSAVERKRRGRRAGDGDAGRDVPERARGDAPPLCGWDNRTLVVLADDPDEGRSPFQRRFSISADGQRLVEVIQFDEGLSGEFTLSLVWDRLRP